MSTKPPSGRSAGGDDNAIVKTRGSRRRTQRRKKAAEFKKRWNGDPFGYHVTHHCSLDCDCEDTEDSCEKQIAAYDGVVMPRRTNCFKIVNQCASPQPRKPSQKPAKLEKSLLAIRALSGSMCLHMGLSCRHHSLIKCRLLPESRQGWAAGLPFLHPGPKL